MEPTLEQLSAQDYAEAMCAGVALNLHYLDKDTFIKESVRLIKDIEECAIEMSKVIDGGMNRVFLRINGFNLWITLEKTETGLDLNLVSTINPVMLQLLRRSIKQKVFSVPQAYARGDLPQRQALIGFWFHCLTSHYPVEPSESGVLIKAPALTEFQNKINQIIATRLSN